MRWQRGHQSPDVIDARNRSAGGVGAGTAFTLFRLGSMFGWKGIVAAGVLVGGAMLVSTMQQGALDAGPAGSDPQAEFVAFVLDDVQGTWDRELPGYRHAQLVLFRDATPTACGHGQAATGPFYCPLDQRVYLDLSFFDELSARFGAPGDFAQAYVVAHEVAHHVQNLEGVHDRVPQGRRAQGAGGASVRVELQADCLAGVWAHDAARRGLLEIGDPDEALRAAAAIGDDRLQRQTGGTVSPETFTHGTSEQRARWFRKGLESGDVGACGTLTASRL